MIILTPIHDAKRHYNTKQILVFANAIQKELFDQAMLDQDGSADSHVMYKIRAISYYCDRNGARTHYWNGYLYDGQTGKSLWKSKYKYTTPAMAIAWVYTYLKSSIWKTFMTDAPKNKQILGQASETYNP